jgi:hypothetical protein
MLCGMANMSRSAFEAALQRLGYGEIELDESHSCRHMPETSAVFHMPDAEVVDGARTYGDLGWFKFLGCVDCCRDMAGVLACGGMYSNVRVFDGEVDVTSETLFEPSALRPADEPLPDDEDA